MRPLLFLTLCSLWTTGCTTSNWVHDNDTVPMLSAAGFRVARVADGAPRAELRPGRVTRRIDGSGVRYFHLEPGSGTILVGSEDDYARYEQLRMGRAARAEPAVFLGFSYGTPVGF